MAINETAASIWSRGGGQGSSNRVSANQCRSLPVWWESALMMLQSPVSIDNSLELRALVKGDGGLLSGRRPAGQALKDRADMLVLVGPGGEHTAPWEKKLIEEAALMGMPVAVVGTQDMEGVLTEFATIGALAIDSLDSVVGRVGLIRGLLWGSSGYYGSGKEAVGLLPQPQR